MNVNNMTADPDNWDEIAPPLGDYPLRPYNVLAADPYCAPPGARPTQPIREEVSS